ncbi:MAG: IgGFc-binding protein, partial [Deltaproteobacteria bacterium]|nr:IgGFc-binding protein [Deltaproteobacteria bacterium]
SWNLIEDCTDLGLICAAGECVDTTVECAEAINAKSYIGCEYWGVDMDNYTATLPYGIVVSNMESSTVHVDVEQRDSLGWNVVESADIPSETAEVFLLGNTTTNGSFHLPYKAFRVTSDAPVVAYQFNPYSGLTSDDSDICTNDGTLLIPRSALDLHYYALVYPPNVSEAMIVIAGTEDDTTVQVTASANINAGTSVPAISAGSTETFVIQAADVI